MMNLRFMLVMVLIALGFGFFGCSQSANPEPSPSAIEPNGQTLAEESGQARAQVQWWRDEAIVAQLELSDDQVDVVNDLMTVNTGDGNQERQLERKVTLRYLRVLNQEPYDAALADEMSKRLNEVLSSKHRRRIQNIRALREILTLEQWKKLWEIHPQIFQLGDFRILLGPRISVTDSDVSPTPTP